MLRLILVPMLLSLLLLSCASDQLSQAEAQIRDSIYEIEKDFNWNDIDGIMAQVSPDFLHNGLNRQDLRALWLQRRALYELLDCQITLVEVDDYDAVVHMRMEFTGAEETLEYQEPESFGDASYFRFDGNVWRLYGNQDWSAVLP